MGNDYQTPDNSVKCFVWEEVSLLRYPAVFGVSTRQSMFVFNSKILSQEMCCHLGQIHGSLNELKVKVVLAFSLILPKDEKNQSQ